MTTPQTTNTNRLITLISGLFLVAALAVFGSQVNLNLDIERPNTNPATADAQAFQEGNSKVSFNLNVQPKPVSIDRFDTMSGDYEFQAGQEFYLIWETSNANQVGAYGGSSSWGGSLSHNANQRITVNTPGMYTYGLRAEGHGANPEVATSTRTIEITQPPEFSLSGHDVALDGVPGSTADMELTLESLYDYEGEVLLSIDSVCDDNGCAANQNGNGDELIDFSFSDASPDLDPGDIENVTLDMGVLRPIRTDVEYEVTIQGDDQSGNAAKTEQEITITINAEGFSPRTIEEF